MRAICLPLLAIFLAGCDDFDLGNIGGSDRYREDFHFSYPLSTGGSLRLENFNGSVEISGWDKNTVDIDGTKYANTEYRLKEMKVEVTPSANSIDDSDGASDRPSWKCGGSLHDSCSQAD